jgi:hypothetical protein
MQKGNAHNLDWILGTFNICILQQDAHLEEWLNCGGTLNSFELEWIEKLHESAKLEANHWNEEELKMRLVSVLLLMASLDEPQRIKTFFERPLKGIIENYQLMVITDCMVATPFAINTPKTPYFFLQEYKKGRGDTKDPEAQMLAAMLIAQSQNQDKKPLYGSYIIGTDWYFTTLLGKDYCCSREFDVRNLEDLKQIVFVLRHLKELILNR